ncbi:hypothetical protein CMV_027192, partial [Castanea mollissima]
IHKHNLNLFPWHGLRARRREGDLGILKVTNISENKEKP